MKKQNIYVSVAIIIVAIALGIWLGHRSVAAPAGLTSATSTPDGTTAAGAADATGDKSFTLACDAQKEMMVTFHLPADQSVDLMLSDGRTLSLANTSTTTGASYTSADGKDILSLAGSTLSLTEDGTATYSNCALNSSAAAAAGTDTDSTDMGM